MIRETRETYESQKKDFVKAKYAVLQNPLNMSEKEIKSLRNFLNQFP
ncbi:MAG: hypothetical protein K9W44_12315 [Candidatus Lokiarchaeota archaeon]|nr:hypothetical protein [Candidatus Harpocratesius repetitus]